MGIYKAFPFLLGICFLSNVQIFGCGLTFSKETIPDNNQKEPEPSAAGDYIGIYKKHISNLRFGQCPMTPSCSNYGLQSFQNNNFIKGFLLTSDRLTRCGYDHQFYQISCINKPCKLIDLASASASEVYRLSSGHLQFKPFNDSAGLSDFNLNYVGRKIVEKDFKEALRYINQLEFEKKQLSVSFFLNKLICLRGLGDLEQVIFEYEINCPTLFKSNPEVLLEVSLSSFYLGDNFKALTTLNQIDTISLHEYNGLDYRINVLRSIILLELKQFNESIKYATKISNTNVKNEFIKIINSSETFKPKRKGSAYFLAIIPGLGYVYTKHYQTALQSILVNGLLGYSTYTNFKVKNYGMGILTGLLGISFYIGNIQGSAASAVRFNDKYFNSNKNHLLLTSQIN
jgi:putative component of membrane protein insertase Oxa1/YidC/SpoIIIJ protein YidD